MGLIAELCKLLFTSKKNYPSYDDIKVHPASTAKPKSQTPPVRSARPPAPPPPPPLRVVGGRAQRPARTQPAESSRAAEYGPGSADEILRSSFSSSGAEAPASSYSGAGGSFDGGGSSGDWGGSSSSCSSSDSGSSSSSSDSGSSSCGGD